MADMIRLLDGRNIAVPSGTSLADATRKLNTAGIQYQETGDEFSFFEKFGYAWGQEKNDVQKAGAWLASRFPIRHLDNNAYASEQEKEWFYNQASPDERLQYIRNSQAKDAARRNPRLAAAIQQGNVELGAAGMLGSMAKQLASPTTLIPMGSGYKTLALGGALLGAEWEVLDQAYNQERFNMGDVGTAAGVGGLLAPAGAALMKQAPRAYNALKYRATPKNIATANQKMQNYQDHMIRMLAKSNANDDMMLNNPNEVISQFHQRALAEVDMDEDAFFRTKRLASQDFVLPRSITQAKALLEGAEDRLGALVPQYRKPNLIGSLIGNISREAERLSPMLSMKFRRFDRQVQETVHGYTRQLDDWAALYGMAAKKFGSRLRLAYVQNDADALYGMFSEVGGAERTAAARDAFRNVMKQNYKDLTEKVGYNFEELPDYMPTRVTDYTGMAEHLEFSNPNTNLQRERERYMKRFKIREGEMTDAHEQRFLNRFVRGQTFDPAAKRNPAVKHRKIARSDITEDLVEKYYADPMQSIVEYLGRTANDVHKVEFFGGRPHLVMDQLGESIDLNKSIGGLLHQLSKTEWKNSKNLDEQISAARTLVTSRFQSADIEPSELLKKIRGMAYLSTLPNPMTALVQLGDLGVSVYKYGVQDTFNAIFRKGQNPLSVDDFGLGDSIAAEMSSVGGIQKALDWTLTKSGFRAMDRLGKNTLLRGALNAGKRFASMQNPSRAAAEWENRWAKRFGEDGLARLKSDLRNDIMSDDVKDYLWSSLADNQPIGKSELPRAYHDNPNARIMYSLKSFMIKQLNFLGQEIADEARRRPKTAMRNLSRYMLTAGVAGMTVSESRRFLMGESVKPEDLPDAYAWNFLKMVGLNEYLLEKHGSGNQFGGMVGELLMPPHSWAVEAVKDVGRVATGEFGEIKSYRSLPIGGNIIYNFFGGGLENKMKYNDSESWLR